MQLTQADLDDFSKKDSISFDQLQWIAEQMVTWEYQPGWQEIWMEFIFKHLRSILEDDQQQTLICGLIAKFPNSYVLAQKLSTWKTGSRPRRETVRALLVVLSAKQVQTRWSVGGDEHQVLMEHIFSELLLQKRYHQAMEIIIGGYVVGNGISLKDLLQADTNHDGCFRELIMQRIIGDLETQPDSDALFEAAKEAHDMVNSMKESYQHRLWRHVIVPLYEKLMAKGQRYYHLATDIAPVIWQLPSLH